MPTPTEKPNEDPPVETVRQRMIRQQLLPRGIRDPAVLAAMGRVPREEFIANALAPRAYEDGPLPTLAGQTISQPYIVAASAQAGELKPTDRVLEVGTGSGYSAAVLSACCREVYSVERNPVLATSARARLERLGYRNCQVLCTDGSIGWPNQAPFAAIIVAAAGPRVPPALLEQLAIGGRLIIPVGAREEGQTLYRVRRHDQGLFEYEPLLPVRFVQLVGEQAFVETDMLPV